jgi:hypothetical protein
MSAVPVVPVIPESALLEVGHFPDNGWRVVERSQAGVGIPEWAGWLSNCPGHRPLQLRAVVTLS